jgi:hypothetical protein
VEHVFGEQKKRMGDETLRTIGRQRANFLDRNAKSHRQYEAGNVSAQMTFKGDTAQNPKQFSIKSSLNTKF